MLYAPFQGTTTFAAAGTQLIVAPRLGDKATNATSNGSGSTTKFETGVLGSLTANQYIGYVIKITSGALSGATRLITANDTSSFDVDISFGGSPANAVTAEIYAPHNSIAVVTDWNIKHTATPGTVELRSRGLVNGVLTTKTLNYYTSGAATAGTVNVSGARLTGPLGGDLRVVFAGATAGECAVNGFYSQGALVPYS